MVCADALLPHHRKCIQGKLTFTAAKNLSITIMYVSIREDSRVLLLPTLNHFEFTIYGPTYRLEFVMHGDLEVMDLMILEMNRTVHLLTK